MFIDDEELRALFKTESGEHLLRLDALLRQLEADPEDSAALAESLRVVHSLKGAARMVGVTGVEALAHGVEDRLITTGDPAAPLTGLDVAWLYSAFDAMHAFVHEAVSGTPAPQSAADGAFQVETMRVDPQRLDRLMIHAGELVVARTRARGRLDELNQIVDDAERAGTSQSLRSTLARLRVGMADDVALLDGVTTRLEEGVSAIRLVPFAAVFDLFPRMVRDIGRDSSKQVQLDVQGGGVTADKRIVEEMKDPLMHLLRNAIDHGVEPPDARIAAGKPAPATVRVRAAQEGTRILIEVSDDGRGLDADAIRRAAVARGLVPAREAAGMNDAQVRAMVFAPGFSTAGTVTSLSGRGIGLDVVKRAVQTLEGTVSVESTPGQGSSFVISLPVSLIATRVLVVADAGELYALPLASIVTTVRVDEAAVFMLDGRHTTLFGGRAVSMAALAQLLERPGAAAIGPPWTCVIVTDGASSAAFSVAALVDEQEVIVKPHTGLVKRVRNVAGATILPNGAVCPVLNVGDLLKSVQQRRNGGLSPAPLAPAPPAAVTAVTAAPAAAAVLLAEDSITTRTWEKRLLESAGYEVVTAVDGRDALQKFGTRAFDAVVSDVQMPNLDGLGLVAAIRRDSRHGDVPIVLVTSLSSEEDRRRGLDAGADAYLVKSKVDQTLLVETLKRLIG